jgi:phenylpyruvate tautomerase PptA (4-oxalocrotonate tautomerase family)
MPLVTIALRRGKPAAWRRAIADGVYAALRATFAVPEDDRFILVQEHDAETFDVSPTYAGMARSEDAVIIVATVSATRTVDQKQALYADIVARLGRDPGLRPDDVFVNLVEVAKENWSFGRGIAQYA